MCQRRAGIFSQGQRIPRTEHAYHRRPYLIDPVIPITTNIMVANQLQKQNVPAGREVAHVRNVRIGSGRSMHTLTILLFARKKIIYTAPRALEIVQKRYALLESVIFTSLSRRKS